MACSISGCRCQSFTPQKWTPTKCICLHWHSIHIQRANTTNPAPDEKNPPSPRTPSTPRTPRERASTGTVGSPHEFSAFNHAAYSFETKTVIDGNSSPSPTPPASPPASPKEDMRSRPFWRHRASSSTPTVTHSLSAKELEELMQARTFERKREQIMLAPDEKSVF